MSESRPPAPTVVPLGAGRFSVQVDGRTHTAFGVRVAGASWVFLDGHVFVVNAAAQSVRAGAGRDEPGSLSAPMPATVIGIDAHVGQRVAAGDVLMRLEAMKMEWPVRAPRDGTVVAIKCREGELVQPGVPLLEMD